MYRQSLLTVSTNSSVFHERQLTHDSDVLHSGSPVFQDSEGYLRVRVVQGDEISRTLSAGERNYLTAVEVIQRFQYQGKNIDTESANLVGVCFDALSATEYFSHINCLDPWLFEKAKGTQEEQLSFYRKVWRLHNHVNHQILLDQFEQPMKLRQVMSNFPMLQVIITVHEEEGGEQRQIGLQEDTHYTLSRVSVERVEVSNSNACEEENGAERNHKDSLTNSIAEPSERTRHSLSSISVKYIPPSQLPDPPTLPICVGNLISTLNTSSETISTMLTNAVISQADWKTDICGGTGVRTTLAQRGLAKDYSQWRSLRYERDFIEDMMQDLKAREESNTYMEFFKALNFQDNVTAVCKALGHGIKMLVIERLSGEPIISAILNYSHQLFAKVSRNDLPILYEVVQKSDWIMALVKKLPGWWLENRQADYDGKPISTILQYCFFVNYFAACAGRPSLSRTSCFEDRQSTAREYLIDNDTTITSDHLQSRPSKQRKLDLSTHTSRQNVQLDHSHSRYFISQPDIDVKDEIKEEYKGDEEDEDEEDTEDLKNHGQTPSEDIGSSVKNRSTCSNDISVRTGLEFFPTPVEARTGQQTVNDWQMCHPHQASTSVSPYGMPSSVQGFSYAASNLGFLSQPEHCFYGFPGNAASDYDSEHNVWDQFSMSKVTRPTRHNVDLESFFSSWDQTFQG